MQTDVSVTIATPEDAPLAIFGTAVSDGVQRLVEENGILTITSAHYGVPEPGRVSIRPDGRTLNVDRIVALPQLFGPSTPGVPGGAQGGFIPIDKHCRVKRLEGVYAAGDATDFAIKHKGSPPSRRIPPHRRSRPSRASRSNRSLSTRRSTRSCLAATSPCI